MSFHRVVLAVDLDPMALKTLSQIRELNLDKNAEIHLVHVFELALYQFELTPLLPPSDEDYVLIEKVVQDKLEKVKNDMGLQDHQKVILKCLISESARQEFMQYIDIIKPDLVVAASQEKTGLKGFFEGSFTSFLSKFSRFNLLILRPER